MTQPFLITGLPRSRTAWWAIATTTPKSVCVHEPIKDTTCFADLARYWELPNFEYVGVSDSGCTYQLGRILADIEPRTLIVDRPIADVQRSLESMFVRLEMPFDRRRLKATLEEMTEQLEKHGEHRLVRWVEFDALQDADTVAECFNWLLSGLSPRPDMLHMNIQVERSHAIETMRLYADHNKWFLED